MKLHKTSVRVITGVVATVQTAVVIADSVQIIDAAAAVKWIAISILSQVGIARHVEAFNWKLHQHIQLRSIFTDL